MNALENLTPAQKLIRRFDQMKADRTNWDSYWQDLSEYFVPNKDNVYGLRLDGEKKHNRLYDSTSVLVNEMLASTLHGMFTNPSSVWFDLSTGDHGLDVVPAVRDYIQTCVRRMIDVMNASNFQEEIHETYIDLGGIGTTVLCIDEDDETHVRFRSEPIYGSYISENSKGEVDTRFCSWQRTLRQLMEEHEDVLPDDIKFRFQTHPEHKEEVIYGIYPEWDGPRKRWVAMTALRKGEVILKKEYYDVWPSAIPRWSKINSEVYGRSPSMKCLPDVKMLNSIMKTTIRGMQKAVDPPVMVPDNGFLLPLNMTPGGTNYYRTGMKDRIEIFPQGARPDIALDFVENVRSRVREHFFWDQMQLIKQRDMTAMEVAQRTDENLRFWGPIVGRLNNELLRPIVDRVFYICNKRGLLPAPPKELAKIGELKIIYTSQIAKAQRSGEANVMNKVLQAMGPLLQTNPDVFDNIDADGMFNYHASIFGVPKEMLNTPDEVQAVRKQRASQQAAQQKAMMEQMQSQTSLNQAKAQQAAPVV